MYLELCILAVPAPPPNRVPHACLQKLYATFVLAPNKLRRPFLVYRAWDLERSQFSASAQTQKANLILPPLLVAQSYQVAIVDVEDELRAFMEDIEIEDRR